MFLVQRRSNPLFQIVILNKKSQGQLAIGRLLRGPGNPASPQRAAKRATLAVQPTGSSPACRTGCWVLL